MNSADYVGQVQNSLYGMHGRVQSSDTATDTTNVLRDGQRRARQGRGGSGGPDHNDCGRSGEAISLSPSMLTKMTLMDISLTFNLSNILHQFKAIMLRVSRLIGYYCTL